MILQSLICTNAFAGTFNGLEPGVSTKTDAHQVLGEPKEEVIKNERYVYDANKFDLKVLSVVFHKESGIIKMIELYPSETVYFEKVRGWFKLNDAFEHSFDESGNLVETFLPHAVRLHYEGTNNLSPVLYFEHFDPIEYEDLSMLPKERPYLGIQLISHKGRGYKIAVVEKDSPSEAAGLLEEDIILAVAGKEYRDLEIDPTTFMSVLALLPIDANVQFKIKRAEEEIVLSVTLKPMTVSQLEKAAQESLLLFQQGQFLLNNGDTYGALDLFKNAIWLNPYEPLYYASLADAYYRIGLVDFAVDELEKSVQMSPQYFSYFLLGTISSEKGEYDEAIGYYKKALALNAEDVQVRDKLGFSYMRKEMYGEALNIFNVVFETNPKSPIALFFSAVCHEKLNNYEKALIFYKKYLATDPEHPEMRKEAEEKVEFFRN